MSIKTFIIAAITADGFIAESDFQKSTDWTSKADKMFFRSRTKEAGVVIMGSKTYETISKPLKDRRTIVYSGKKSYEGVETTTEKPSDLIARLEKEGAKEIAICGGASIYNLFIKEKAVDTLYLTIEPHLFGKGISLLSETMHIRLEFVKVEHIGDGSVLLEYRIKG